VIKTLTLTKDIIQVFRFLKITVLLFFYLATFAQQLLAHSATDDPEFFIKTPKKKLIFKRSSLVTRPDKVEIKIEADPAYSGKSTIYQAIPLNILFEKLPIAKEASLLFHCLDGFSAPISQTKLLNSSNDKAIAYLAIESLENPWPALNAPINPHSAGPFYIVWMNPKLSNIGREEWPYQLIGLEIKQSITSTYPGIFPNEHLSPKHPAMIGLEVFTRNCFSCHTMNLQGESSLGPDLNVPMSPTEYLTPKALVNLIRNPQSMRYWPLSKMPGFPDDQISDNELSNLLKYLKYMSKNRATHTIAPKNNSN
jgi:mono/diheme cytochrome c family protein